MVFADHDEPEKYRTTIDAESPEAGNRFCVLFYYQEVKRNG